jgi:hypothetical protein
MPSRCFDMFHTLAGHPTLQGLDLGRFCDDEEVLFSGLPPEKMIESRMHQNRHPSVSEEIKSTILYHRTQSPLDVLLRIHTVLLTIRTDSDDGP